MSMPVATEEEVRLREATCLAWMLSHPERASDPEAPPPEAYTIPHHKRIAHAIKREGWTKFDPSKPATKQVLLVAAGGAAALSEVLSLADLSVPFAEVAAAIRAEGVEAAAPLPECPLPTPAPLPEGLTDPVAALDRMAAEGGVTPGASRLEACETLTDVGNSARVVNLHGEFIAHSDAVGWLVWNGPRWVANEKAMAELCKATALSIYDEAKAEPDKDKQRAFAKWAQASQSVGRIDAMRRLASSDPRVSHLTEDFDRDPRLLNLPNGTLHLDTMHLRAHRKADLLTKLAPVAYDPAAGCPTWTAFLERILPDVEVRAFLQRFVGYCLTGLTTEQVLVLLHGLGRNGKTVLLEVLRAMLGDYSRAAAFDTLLPRRSPGAPRDDLARLVGARLVTATEPPAGARFDEGTLKALTGDETVVSRRLYREGFEWRPTFKLFLAANHRPRFDGADFAMRRRILLVPFTVTIPEEEVDRDLPRKLLGELPGILNWSCDGFRAWRAMGLAAPEAVRIATEEYARDEDHVGVFLDETCELGRDFLVSAAVLREHYLAWCKEAGEDPLIPRQLGERMRSKGAEPDKNLGGRIWRGVRIRTEAPDA